jgi:hypothetical protein
MCYIIIYFVQCTIFGITNRDRKTNKHRYEIHSLELPGSILVRPKIDSIAGTKLFNIQTVICNTFPTNLLSDMQQSTNSKRQVLKY